MKKIVLTSCGIIDKNLIEEFQNLFTKNMESLKMLYIPLAADVEEGDMSWLEEEFNTILNLGIKKENIIEYRMDYEIDVNSFDCIYIIGGNTFYLLKKIREYEFDKKITKAINSGVVYIGSSAGSIIMGNTIEASCDENIYTDDFTGLKCFNGIIIPHANKRKKYIEGQKKRFSDKIYCIEDEHGIVVKGEDIKEI